MDQNLSYRIVMYCGDTNIGSPAILASTCIRALTNNGSGCSTPYIQYIPDSQNHGWRRKSSNIPAINAAKHQHDVKPGMLFEHSSVNLKLWRNPNFGHPNDGCSLKLIKTRMNIFFLASFKALRIIGVTLVEWTPSGLEDGPAAPRAGPGHRGPLPSLRGPHCRRFGAWGGAAAAAGAADLPGTVLEGLGMCQGGGGPVPGRHFSFFLEGVWMCLLGLEPGIMGWFLGQIFGCSWGG